MSQQAERIYVRALRMGFSKARLGFDRKKPGDCFWLEPHDGFVQGKDGKLKEHHFTAEQQFSPHWMEKIDPPADGREKKAAKKVDEPREAVALSQIGKKNEGKGVI